MLTANIKKPIPVNPKPGSNDQRRKRMIRSYESMIILDPTLTQEELEKENNKILDFIRDNGGEVIKTDIWGKRRLAYLIAKKSEGFYLINYFQFESKNTKVIEKFYQINERILRFNLINLEQ
jgi:small subunit ribosomal protein S6